MWSIREIENNPTSYLIIDAAGTVISCVYNREFASEVVTSYNSLKDQLALSRAKCERQRVILESIYERTREIFE